MSGRRLTRAILETLVFFDAQDRPLLLTEIQNYLIRQREGGGEFSLLMIQRTLDLELSGQVGYSRGLYFLRGRAELVGRWRRNYRLSLQRLRLCRRVLWPLRFFPYVRAVAISGSLAILGSSAKSDIDLFIITRRSRIWLARLLVSAYFQILGRRRHGAKIAGRFCLNHYLCAGQDISEDRNLYTAAEYASLLPVMGAAELENFWRRNSWISGYFRPGFSAAVPFFDLQFSRWQKIFERVLNVTLAPLLNLFGGIYQKWRIRSGDYILVSDQELSFHPGSRGQKLLQKYDLTRAKIGLQ